MYISNESSTLDVCIFPALGLPNTRFFMTGAARKYLPLAVFGYLTGIFWTPPQSKPEKRMRVFQRAERILRHTGASVYCSPEGMRNTTGQIGHFNKGAFHLATSLGRRCCRFTLPPRRRWTRGWGGMCGRASFTSTFSPGFQLTIGNSKTWIGTGAKSANCLSG